MEDFELHEVDTSTPGYAYIFSDGFQDQFGGEKGKKYMSKKFRNLLFNFQSVKMNNQEKELHTTFNNWIGNQEQVDDVLVIGLAIA
ncbi:hypothetical protein OAH12_02490 [Cyclobacteriaceae bacterium]|nr:hypothetical protein [Cyclobacteriaceae bacterium]